MASILLLKLKSGCNTTIDKVLAFSFAALKDWCIPSGFLLFFVSPEHVLCVSLEESELFKKANS